MSEPLAYLLTWTTYGTWLPGDDRGWVETGQGIQPPDAARREFAQQLMTENLCKLTAAQREIVEQTIVDHCRIRGWQLHAINCRSNHVHVVVSSNCSPKEGILQFKAYCTRRLKEHQRMQVQTVRKKWWTEGGSKRYLDSQRSLEAAVHYVVHGQ